MDLNNFFVFDEAALDFTNSLTDESVSYFDDPMLSSGDEATQIYHGLSEDSGFDHSNYFGDTEQSKGSPPSFASKVPVADATCTDPQTALTMLTAPPTETSFKYMIDNNPADLLVQAVPDAPLKIEPLQSSDESPKSGNDSTGDTSDVEIVSIPEKVQYSARSKTGKVELKIMTQPSRNHRARYRTEGSRGAVKDRSGRSFPVVKLTGYNKTPVKLRCYIGHDKRMGEPHLFYQVSKIVGKHVTPCQVAKIEGIKVVEIDLLPSANMQAVINCIGIVKERNFDVQRKATNLKKKHLYDENDKTKVGIERRSTSCTLVFGCQIPNSAEILQVVSDPINCAQLLGCPEIHKISTTKADLNGGEEMFIIGKNFTRATRLVWENGSDWYQVTEPEAEYVNQNHLVCKIPAFTGTVVASADQTVDVTFKLKCGEDKYSEPYLFSYSIPTAEVDAATWQLITQAN